VATEKIGAIKPPGFNENDAEHRRQIVDYAGAIGDFINLGRSFADIYASDVEAEHTIADTGQENRVQIVSFNANGESREAAPDYTNDHITVTRAGIYLVNVSMTLESVAGAAAEFGYAVYKNDGATEVMGLHGHRDLAAGGGQHGSVALSGIADLAVDDTVEVWIWNETNTQNIKIGDINLSIVEVG
jgi:hypothetical protein